MSSSELDKPGFERHLRAMGSLVVNFNVVDHSLRRIAWLLVDHTNERIGHIVVDSTGVAKIEELVESLAKERQLSSDLRARIATGVADCRRVRQQRNDYVHAAWRVPNNATDFSKVEAVSPPTRKRPEYRLVDGSASAEALQAASKEAYALGTELESIRIDLLAELTRAT